MLFIFLFHKPPLPSTIFLPNFSCFAKGSNTHSFVHSSTPLTLISSDDAPYIQDSFGVSHSPTHKSNWHVHRSPFSIQNISPQSPLSLSLCNVLSEASLSLSLSSKFMKARSWHSLISRPSLELWIYDKNASWLNDTNVNCDKDKYWYSSATT